MRETFCYIVMSVLDISNRALTLVFLGQTCFTKVWMVQPECGLKHNTTLRCNLGELELNNILVVIQKVIQVNQKLVLSGSSIFTV